MEKSILACIFIFLCAQLLLSSLALDNSNNSAQENQNGNGKEIGGEHGIVLKAKGQGAKGTYGSANVVHRRPSEKGGSQKLYMPSSIIFLAGLSVIVIFA